MSKRVVVLMGGFSAEREVSLASGAACAAALETAGYAVATIDVRRDLQTLASMRQGSMAFLSAASRKSERLCRTIFARLDTTPKSSLQFGQQTFPHRRALNPWLWSRWRSYTGRC